MIGRVRRRFLGAAPADQRLLVEAEAQHDLARAMREEIEALRLEKAQALKRAADAEQKLTESEQREAVLKVRVALALVTDFMHTALRQRASVRLEQTVELRPRRDPHAPTEYFPIHRRREHRW